MASEIGRGAQVRLDDTARALARGGNTARLIDNIRAKQAGEQAGTLPSGNTPDGSLGNGTAADDEVLTPGGEAGITAAVTFTAAGTGAVARTPQDKMRESVSVRDYGAVGDGVTDDTVAFSRAAAANTGKSIRIPSGLYVVNTIHIFGYWIYEPGSAFTGTGRVRSLARGFWKEDAGNVNLHYLKDRVFVDSATNYDGGNQVLAGTSWLGSPSSANYFWVERSSSFTSLSGQGGIGGTFGSRASDNAVAGHSSIGLAAIALNDVANRNVWACYIEGMRRAGAAGVTYGLELNVKNNGTNGGATPGASSPYTRWNAGTTIGVWLAAGGDPGLNAPTAPSSAALVIGRNSHTWNRGIVFDSAGLTGADGTTGTADAITLAKGHKITWHYSTTEAQGAGLWSEVTNTVPASSLVMSDAGLEVRSATSANRLFRVAVTNTAVNGIVLSPSGAGGSVVISAEGTDTNISVQHNTKGTGPHYFMTGGQTVPAAAVPHVASAANYVELTASAAGGSPYLQANGSDANVGIRFFAKGTGRIDAGAPLKVPGYALASLPSAATYADCMVRVTDRSNRPAVSDGTNWRFTDGSVVS